MLSKSKSKLELEPSVLDRRPAKQGFLVKHKCIRGGWSEAVVTNNWKRRWFELRGTTMLYFSLPSDRKPKGHFDLSGAKLELAEDKSGRPFSFAVETTQNTTFVLVASSADTFSNWFTLIRAIVQPEEVALPASPKGKQEEATPAPTTKGGVEITMKRARFKTMRLDTVPCERQFHSAFLVDGVRMLVFGGQDAQGAALGDVLVFNLSNAGWDHYQVTGQGPSARHGHSSTCLREKLVFFGGRNGDALLNDAFALDTDELAWSALETENNPPPRACHGACIVDSSLWVIGGEGEGGKLLSDVHALDMQTLQWKPVNLNPSLPSRAGQACCGMGDRVLVFGGRGEAGPTNSTHSINHTDLSVHELQCQGSLPSPRQHAFVSVFKNRILFVVGGEGANALYNDAWALDMDQATWMRVHVGGQKLPIMSRGTAVIKDQVMYLFGGRAFEGLVNSVSVMRIQDRGLPSINLRAARPSVLLRTQVPGLRLDHLEVGVTLGTGSFGRVHCVKHKQTGKFYALKMLKKKHIIHLGQVSHILAEKDVLSSISHPHIVNYVGCFQDPARLYIAMEFVNGGEFFTHLRSAGRFKEDTARFYAAQTLTALEYLHSNNIVYRDLKPENILLDANGHLKMTDFGFAKQVEFRTWTLCGTPEYLAPELILSKGHSKPVDYWALGILIFEMLAGYPPFSDSETLRIYQKILQGDIKWPRFFSPDAQDLISKLLVAEPAKRLGSSKKGPTDIKSHPWFKVIDWEDIAGCGLQAPIQPKVASEGDTRNFEAYENEDDEPEPCTESENAQFKPFG